MRRTLLTLFCMVLAWPLWGNEKEGGIIGTGAIGQVTGIGEFEVNGMRFTLPTETTVDGVDSIADLDIGMTIAMRAENDGAEWRTTYLRRLPVLVGPVTGPSEVMGMTVIGDVPDKGWVSVDGFWSEAGVIASRVVRVGEGVQRITGPFSTDGRVGSLAIVSDISPDLRDGDIVAAEGQFSDGVFRVTGLESTIFRGRAPELILTSGYPSTPDESGMYRLLGTGAEAMSGGSQSVHPEEKITRCALRGKLDFDLAALESTERAVVIAFCPEISG